ncbi:serine/threonine protein kinase [Lujinxingia vulgaris]|uniref:non-specific serine/threonine protein kinase n=1 Tax=Lujinxingia vulgaris TaxID=2600176 RepID=A0A5C6XEG8_9DELT|nr:serine/threonine-protein kinase [Lujinxingia vulgaris]TXD36514.1 serine/threonine protein kinase [Lujinxingia vulgaris]
MTLYCPQCQQRFDGDLEVCPSDGSRLFNLDSPGDAPDPLLGQVIDERFRIERLLGVGGMGAVYAGVQLSVNREVAIKVLRPEMSDREKALERFFREAKVVSELSHANIVSLFDFGQDRQRDLLYLVMELVRGINLGDLLERGRFRVNMALEVVYQVCGALTEPHARGIIHRDLKPDNLVMLPVSDGTVQVKVLDFGIARALEQSTQITKTGMICGTPAYMAPEQAQNHAIDARTDLYALGIILYEMLSGMVPFTGDTSLQILFSHVQKSPPSLRHILPAGSLPEDIEALCYRMLSKDPAERPRSAREVRDEIDHLRMRHQLRPVRLDVDRQGTGAFEPWLMPHLEGTGRGGPSSTEALRQAPQTGGFGLAPRTGELESMPTIERHTPTDIDRVRVGADARPFSSTQPQFQASPATQAPGQRRTDTITGESKVETPAAVISGDSGNTLKMEAEGGARSRTGLLVALVVLLLGGGAVAAFALGGDEGAGAEVEAAVVEEEAPAAPVADPAPEPSEDALHAESAGARVGLEAMIAARLLTAESAAVAAVAEEAARQQATSRQQQRERPRVSASDSAAEREARAAERQRAIEEARAAEEARQAAARQAAAEREARAAERARKAAEAQDDSSNTDSALRDRLRRLRSGE